MTDALDFDWNGDDAEHVVIRHQPAIACYLNPNGDVAIRQEGHYGPDEDVWIIVGRQNALRLAEAMLEAAGIEVAITPKERIVNQEQQLPAPSKAAERARRYREHKRDAVTFRRDAESVTKRDGVTLTRDAKSLTAAE